MAALYLTYAKIGQRGDENVCQKQTKYDEVCQKLPIMGQHAPLAQK